MDLQIFKGRWREEEKKKEGEESGIHSNAPQTGILCTCVCVRVRTCILINLCFLGPTLFLEMALKKTGKKGMKNAYSLFLCIPLFTFQTPEGSFFTPHPRSGRHRRSSCLTGPGEAGSGRRNEWWWGGGFKWGGEAAALTTATGKSDSFVPENLILTSTRGGILAPVCGAPMGGGEGPEATEHSEGGSFLWGGYCLHPHASKDWSFRITPPHSRCS